MSKKLNQYSINESEEVAKARENSRKGSVRRREQIIETLDELFKNRAVVLDDSKMALGGGVHKHVSVKRGYRLPHGYEAVRGATKKADYSHKGVEMDLGWRLPHGYVLEKGADSKAYYGRGGYTESGYSGGKKSYNLTIVDNNNVEYRHNIYPKRIKKQDKWVVVTDIIDHKNRYDENGLLKYENLRSDLFDSVQESQDYISKKFNHGNQFARGGGVESCTPEEKMFVRALIERYMDNLSSDGKEVATSVLHKLK
jgi:hypothetical protein